MPEQLTTLKRDRQWADELIAWLIGFRQSLDQKIRKIESEQRKLENG